MKLYFRPFACSLAARIALEEGELDAEFVLVEPGRPLPDGRDFPVPETRHLAGRPGNLPRRI